MVPVLIFSMPDFCCLGDEDSFLDLRGRFGGGGFGGEWTVVVASSLKESLQSIDFTQLFQFLTIRIHCLVVHVYCKVL